MRQRWYHVRANCVHCPHCFRRGVRLVPIHTHTHTQLQDKRAQLRLQVSKSSSVGSSNKTEHVRRQEAPFCSEGRARAYAHARTAHGGGWVGFITVMMRHKACGMKRNSTGLRGVGDAQGRMWKEAEEGSDRAQDLHRITPLSSIVQHPPCLSGGTPPFAPCALPPPPPPPPPQASLHGPLGCPSGTKQTIGAGHRRIASRAPETRRQSAQSPPPSGDQTKDPTRTILSRAVLKEKKRGGGRCPLHTISQIGTQVGGDWRLAVGGWWLGAVGGGWQLAVGGGWRLVVGGGWRLAVGGWGWLVVGGWWSLGAVLKGGP